MLTRIEINGFKTFTNFGLKLGAFTVIAGTNASGKSNLFDAIRLLSRLAETDLRRAFAGLRGEPEEVFTCSEGGARSNQMKIVADVLLEPNVRDPWGAERELTQTRLQYSLTMERRTDAKGLERLYVIEESATPIRAGSDTWIDRSSAPNAFRETYLRYKRQSPFLDTIVEPGLSRFQIHQDQTQGRSRPALAAEATVLSSITSAEFTHLFALREEIRSWRFLQLDPAALRQPASKLAADRLEPSGSNLAAVLARIRSETASDTDPMGVLADISADLAQVIPGVRAVDIIDDERNSRWELNISMRDEAPYNARVASDGTLRLLALLTALSDPRHGGLICFEEPENGVHPARLKALIQYLRESASLPKGDGGPDHVLPLTQLIMTTHSPVVVASLHDGEGIFFDTTTMLDPAKQSKIRTTHARHVHKRRQASLIPDEVGSVVSRGEVEEYLAAAATDS